MNLKEIINNTRNNQYFDTTETDVQYFENVKTVIDVGSNYRTPLPYILIMMGYKVNCINKDARICNIKDMPYEIKNCDVTKINLKEYDLAMFLRFCDEENKNALYLNNLIKTLELPRNVIIEPCHDASHYNLDRQLSSGNLVKLDLDKHFERITHNMWLSALDLTKHLESKGYKTEIRKTIAMLSPNSKAYPAPQIILASKK